MQETKPKNWFSRRHETNAEHIATTEKYKAASAKHRAKRARLNHK
jgi:hypothetical protein